MSGHNFGNLPKPPSRFVSSCKLGWKYYARFCNGIIWLCKLLLWCVVLSIVLPLLCLCLVQMARLTLPTDHNLRLFTEAMVDSLDHPEFGKMADELRNAHPKSK